MLQNLRHATPVLQCGAKDIASSIMRGCQALRQEPYLVGCETTKSASCEGRPLAAPPQMSIVQPSPIATTRRETLSLIHKKVPRAIYEEVSTEP